MRSVAEAPSTIVGRRRRRDRHRHPCGLARRLAGGALAAVVVFVLAVMLITTGEVVIGHPFSTPTPGQTSLGQLLHPRPGP